MTRIAIVEDNRIIRESLIDFVQSDPECSCVCVCATAEEALKMIPRHQPEIVLMDIQLPNLSGIECTAQLKQLLPSVQIIMVTVYEDTDRIFRALRAGACGYLLKRTPLDKLLEAITEARLGGAPMTRKIARKVVQYFHQMGVSQVKDHSLSKREQETLALLAEGFRYKEIADTMGISFHTVREYVHSIYQKLHVTSRTEALRKLPPPAATPIGPPVR